MIEISRGDARDVARIMPTMQSAFDAEFGEAWNAGQCTAMLSLPNTALWLAQEDSVVCGFAITRWVLDEEELLMIGVDPVKRSRNIGRKLLETIIENASASLRRSIFLEVRYGNSAILFYNKLRLSYTGRRAAYYTGIDGTKYDAITMSRTLVSPNVTGNN